MKRDDIAHLVLPSPPPAVDATTVYLQIGALTRLLHDTLEQLGVMPGLQQCADGLPDARSRLQYIAGKTADSAERVLNAVELAKAEHAHIAAQAQALAVSLANNPVQALAGGAVMNFIGDVQSRSVSIDRQLTEIMLAQDFHDLTGQVMAKVLSLATRLEDSLLKLLVQVQPAVRPSKADPNELDGPVVAPTGRTDIVANQNEVDDLLASMGF